MLIEVIAAFFVAYGFGILFNIKGKYLKLAGFGGAIGWFAYKFSLLCGMTIPLSYFISAISFGVFCEICARIYHTPSTILAVCSLIPLVPGYGVYNCMYQFIVGDYMLAIQYGVETLSSAGSLALGIILTSTVFKRIKYMKLKLKK